MNIYNYVSGNGTITSTRVNFMWQSLCHNEGIMDNFNMFKDIGGFGWSVCRLCGKPAYFTKKWNK